MKTVVGNDVGLDRSYPLPDIRNGFPVGRSNQEHSCFYDFGVRSSVGFTGAVNHEESDLIDKLGKYFQS